MHRIRKMSRGIVVICGATILSASVASAEDAASHMRASGDPRRDGVVVDKLMADAYARCWDIEKLTHPNAGATSRYWPAVKVERDETGTLIGQPVLVNPPVDDVSRTLAELAVRAVRRCGVIPIPNDLRYLARRWRSSTIRLDPTL